MSTTNTPATSADTHLVPRDASAETSSTAGRTAPRRGGVRALGPSGGGGPSTS